MTREELIQYVSDHGIRWKESTFLKHGILDSFLELTEQYSGSFDYKSKCLRSDAENKCKCCGTETEWSRWIQRWTYYCSNCDPQLNTARLDKDKVLQYYDEHGYAATLEKFGISAHSLGKLGITKTVDQQRRYRKYADAYMSGKSIQKVADEFGTSKAHVRSAMRMYNVLHHSHSEVCKNNHANRSPESYKGKRIYDHDYICQLWDSGMRMEDIAKVLKCKDDTVRIALIRAGKRKKRDRTSQPERALHAFLDRHKIPYEKHNRKHIYPKELDIYIPDHRLAIEVNGLYWHSEDIAVKDTRHLEKFTQCRESGIRLLQFTDQDVINRLPLIESMLAVRLGIAEKIMARKCSVTEISTRIANQFYQQWHYQGATTNSAKSMALIYQNEVVALLSYRQTKDETIIDRYACKPFTTVIGGFTKLESRLSGKLVTFSLGLISDGSLYRNNGYTTEGYSTRPEFYVTDGQILWNRQKFMKTKMPKLFGSGFDPNKTEWQNIVDNGLRLYFGAGITKWVKEKGL